jgi:hypothetical protein
MIVRRNSFVHKANPAFHLTMCHKRACILFLSFVMRIALVCRKRDYSLIEEV